MKRPFAGFGAVLLIVAAGAGLASAPAHAQSRSEIDFQKGNDNAAVTGKIKGHQYADYLLGARAGQTLSASLTIDNTDGHGTAYFNILPPRSNNVAIFNGSIAPDRHGEVKLPQNGKYTIRVYLMGNDKDAGKTVAYTLSVTIGGASAGGSAEGASVDAMIDVCRSYAARKLGVDAGIINLKYEGQRTDGTHAVNGDAETSPAIAFQCSFNRAGSRIVKWVRNSSKGCPADVSQADRYLYPDCK